MLSDQVFFYSAGWDGSCKTENTVGAEFTGTVFHAQCKNDARVYVDTSIDFSKCPFALIDTAVPNNDKR
jgi:hypothetical protein